MEVPRTRLMPGPGAIGGVLLFLGLSSFGDTPDTRDTTTQVAQYFTTNRASVFVGCVLFGLGLLCLLAVSGRIGTLLDAAGQASIGRLVQSAGTVAVTLFFAAMLLVYASLSYVIGTEVPDMAKGFFELTLLTTPILALPLAALVGGTAVGLRRAGLGRLWFLILSAVAVVALLVAACSYARSGSFSPDVQQQVVVLSLIVWLVASRRGVRRHAR